MSEKEETIVDLANTLVAWNDRATKWLARVIETNGDSDETDVEYGFVTVFFKKSELELFQKNQQEADRYLRTVAAYITVKEEA